MANMLDPTALALVAILAIYLACRYWTFGISLVLLLFVAHVFADYFPPLVSKPYNIYPDDIVFLLLALAAIFRLLVRKRVSLLQLSWIGVWLLVLISFFRGVPLYGLASAGNDVRGQFGFVGGVLYFASHPFTPKKFEIFVNAWKYVAWFLVAVALIRWGALVVGLSFGGNWENMGGWLRLRVLNAFQALFLFQAILAWQISIWQRNVQHGSWSFPLLVREQRRTARFAPVVVWVVCLVIVIVLQHRSVWVVGISSYLMILLYERQRMRVVFVTLFLLCITSAMWIFADFGRSVVGESLTESIREPLAEESTFMWRVEQWRSYYNTGYLSGSVEWILGKPFGAPYGSAFGGEEVGPHNWYIFLVLRLGILGLLMVSGALALTCRRLWQLSRSSLPLASSARPLLFLFATMFVFATVYGPGFEQCIYIGLAITIPLKLRSGTNAQAWEESLCRIGRLSNRDASVNLG